MKFEWDSTKDTANQKKHGVSFEEAKTIFYDDYGLLTVDPDHSQDEERFILIGMSPQLRTLVVCHCYREKNQTIRIISARKATKHEANQYKEHLL